MPYRNEHAARIKNPDLFRDNSFRRKVIDPGITIIIGRLIDSDTTTTQAYRFHIDYYTASEAKQWLKDHDIEFMSFEAATSITGDRLNSKSTNGNTEQRIINNISCEYESRFDNEGNKEEYIHGIGIVYNSETEILPGIFEKVRPGAFTQSLTKFNELKCFINHDPSLILSTTKSNPSLEITDNEKGLYFVSPIPPTTYGMDLSINVRRGNINGASFSFKINHGGEEYSFDESGNCHREIIDAEIFEVGPVTNPAYEQTKVTLRNKELIIEKINEIKNHSLNVESELKIISDFLSKRKGR